MYPYLLVKGTDPRIRIRTNMSRLPNTGLKSDFCSVAGSGWGRATKSTSGSRQGPYIYLDPRRVPSNRVTSSSSYNFVMVLPIFQTGLLPLFVKISHF